MKFHGAEAIIEVGKTTRKERIKKGYRIHFLDDKIRKYRTRSEARILERASKVISVPKVISADEKIFVIEMESIEGLRLSDNLDNLSEKNDIARRIGECVAKLHDSDIIHGDLTTSNMILKGKDVFFIDFGLAFMSYKIEDKAVDLHLLRQALEAKHFKYWKEFFEEVKKGYSISEKSKEVLERFEKVEKRGRYKSQI